MRSIALFVGDGCRTVDATQYRQRLEVCGTCDRRLGARCRIALKARGRRFSCPIKRWQ